MIFRAALALLLTSSAAAAPRTGTVVDAQKTAEPTLATLYLRCDRALGSDERVAVQSALRIIARLPGATLDIALEPRDPGSVPLAVTLAALPDTSARVLLLARLLDRGTARWLPLEMLPRPLGMSGGQQRPRFLYPGDVPAAARAFVHRPGGESDPGSSRLVLSGHALAQPPTDEQLDEWATSEVAPETVVAPRRTAYSGASGRRVVVHWRSAKDACGPLQILFDVVRRQRARLVFEAALSEQASAAEQLVGRALALAEPETQLALARLACSATLESRKQAVALLTEAGIDASAPSLADPVVVAPSGQPPTVTIDGRSSTFLDALSLGRPRSLRQRLTQKP